MMMTEKVRFQRRDDVLMPLLELASAEDLAQWYAAGLRQSLAGGERELTVMCFDVERVLGFNRNKTAQKVLRAVTDFLYEHPEAESLTIVCGDEASWRDYNFWWNMLYAEGKPKHAH